MRKDIFLTLAALVVAGVAAFYVLPREGGRSPVSPRFEEGTILGQRTENTSEAEISPDASPHDQAVNVVQTFLIHLLRATTNSEQTSSISTAP